MANTADRRTLTSALCVIVAAAGAVTSNTPAVTAAALGWFAALIAVDADLPRRARRAVALVAVAALMSAGWCLAAPFL